MAARLGRADHAVVRATAEPVGQPFIQRARVGRSPTAVALEPGVSGSYRVRRFGHHVVEDSQARPSEREVATSGAPAALRLLWQIAGRLVAHPKPGHRPDHCSPAARRPSWRSLS